MSKSIFHDIGNELLIAKGMVEIAMKNANKIEGLDPAQKEAVLQKLQKSIDAMGKMNDLLQAAKKEYLYKETA